MKHDIEDSVSLWMATNKPSARPALTADTSAHVCIVGAGIAGLNTAYLLALEGRSVVVLDDGPLAGGQTQRTTAHLSNALDDRYFEIEKIHGTEEWPGGDCRCHMDIAVDAAAETLDGMSQTVEVLQRMKLPL